MIDETNIHIVIAGEYRGESDLMGPLTLPRRKGAKPQTTNFIPHSQVTQHGPDDIIEKLLEWCFALPAVTNEPSGISVPGARALVLDGDCHCSHDAFMIGREFAHIHPHPDQGSMHVKLRAHDANNVIDAGWGEDHFLVTIGHYPPGLIMASRPEMMMS